MSKIILLDVGGTLVDDDNNLPDSAVKAIRAALNSIWKQRPVRQREGFEKGEMALRSATWCLAARAGDCVSLRPPWACRSPTRWRSATATMI